MLACGTQRVNHAPEKEGSVLAGSSLVAPSWTSCETYTTVVTKTRNDLQWATMSYRGNKEWPKMIHNDLDLLTSRAFGRVARAEPSRAERAIASPTIPEQRTKRTTLRKSNNDLQWAIMINFSVEATNACILKLPEVVPVTKVVKRSGYGVAKDSDD